MTCVDYVLESIPPWTLYCCSSFREIWFVHSLWRAITSYQKFENRPSGVLKLDLLAMFFIWQIETRYSVAV